MSETAPALQHGTKVGPGRLVLVVGPSGAGKDTLIDLARAACAADSTIIFVRRVVTRASSSFEDNESMTPEAFRHAQADGAFAADWEAHGHLYGLRSSIRDDVAAGRTVVANVSRTVIAPLRQAFADVVVVSVTAPPEVLAARLAGRSRSSDGDSGARLSRTVDGAASVPDVVITNIGRAEVHADELLRVIRGA